MNRSVFCVLILRFALKLVLTLHDVSGTVPLSACQELFALSPGAENAAIACGAGFGGLQRVCHDITRHQTSIHAQARRQHAGCTLSLASTVWALRSFHS